MSDSPIAPLSRDIEQLLALERDAYGDEPELKSAVLSHVELAVGLRGPSGGGDGGSGSGSPPADGGGGSGGGGGGGGGGALRGAAGKVLGAVGAGAFVVGVVVGGLGGRALTPAPTPALTPALTPTHALTATSVAMPPQPAPRAEPMAPDASDVDPTPRVVPSAGPQPLDAPRAGSDLVREREIIDAARAALSRGRPADALLATARHAERWPRGHLAEEREVIAIQALAASGRRAEADRRAGAFKRAFPSSMLIPAVDQALSTP